MLRNILLITTVPERGAWLQRCLDGAREGPFAVGVVSSCAAAAALLSNADGALTAAVFLESCPGDGPAVAALQRQLCASTHAPLIILCNAGEQESALQGIQRGAQDYLPIEELNAGTVLKALSGALGTAWLHERPGHVLSEGHLIRRRGKIRDFLAARGRSGRVGLLAPIVMTSVCAPSRMETGSWISSARDPADHVGGATEPV